MRSVLYPRTGSSDEPVEAHQVMVECSFWYWAATAKVVLPQAMLRMVHPDRSWKGLGYMVLSPLALSLPHAHSWGPTMQQKLLVLPAATWQGRPGLSLHCLLAGLDLARVADSTLAPCWSLWTLSRLLTAPWLCAGRFDPCSGWRVLILHGPMLLDCSGPTHMQQMLAELPAAHLEDTDQGLPDRQRLGACGLSSVPGCAGLGRSGAQSADP